MNGKTTVLSFFFPYGLFPKSFVEDVYKRQVVHDSSGKWLGQYETEDVTIHNAKKFHDYTVSFLAYIMWDPVHMYNAVILSLIHILVTYANMRGVRAVDRIVELCERDLAFIWLIKGQKPKRDAFYEFKNKKLTADVLDERNYQFLRRLQKEGFILSLIHI